MKPEEITQKHIDVLKFAFNAKQVSHGTVARKMQWDKAMAMSIIGQLCRAGLLSEYTNGLYGVSASGRDVLISSGFEEAERKPAGSRVKKARQTDDVAKETKVTVEPSQHTDANSLVHSGIAKLVDKLNGKPAIISNAQFKFAALNNLASGIEAAEPHVANLLREVAMDIHNAAGLGGDQ